MLLVLRLSVLPGILPVCASLVHTILQLPGRNHVQEQRLQGGASCLERGRHEVSDFAYFLYERK